MASRLQVCAQNPQPCVGGYEVPGFDGSRIPFALRCGANPAPVPGTFRGFSGPSLLTAIRSQRHSPASPSHFRSFCILHSTFILRPGVALVEPWWRFEGALGWPWGGSLVPSRWLCGGLGVALRWLCIPESMPSICLVYGSEVAFRIQVDQVNLAALYRHQARPKPSASAELNSS
jgi:hypothetical protein